MYFSFFRLQRLGVNTLSDLMDSSNLLHGFLITGFPIEHAKISTTGKLYTISVYYTLLLVEILIIIVSYQPFLMVFELTVVTYPNIYFIYMNLFSSFFLTVLIYEW